MELLQLLELELLMRHHIRMIRKNHNHHSCFCMHDGRKELLVVVYGVICSKVLHHSKKVLVHSMLVQVHSKLVLVRSKLVLVHSK